MKPQITKKLFALIAAIMLSFSALVFYNSCQKEINADAINTNDSSGANNANTTVGSKIIYMDLIPDSIVGCYIPTYTGICSSIYYLDLNRDGINDFSIMVSNTKIALTASCPQGTSGGGPKINSTVSVTPYLGNAAFDIIPFRYS